MNFRLYYKAIAEEYGVSKRALTGSDGKVKARLGLRGRR
jgi:hypothetical protein